MDSVHSLAVRVTSGPYVVIRPLWTVGQVNLRKDEPDPARAGPAGLTSGQISMRVFDGLVQVFFDQHGRPRPFTVEPKRSTQDDPFDRLVAAKLQDVLADDGLIVATSSTLASPDLVVYDRVQLTAQLADGADVTAAIGIEIKGLLWDPAAGPAPRSSGIDFSSTPPAPVSIVRVGSTTVKIPSMLLFATRKRLAGKGGKEKRREEMATALVLTAGSLLNDDQALYNTATGVRVKETGVGSYCDGFNRQRPMFVFPNPFTVPELVAGPSLVIPEQWGNEIEGSYGTLTRTRPDGTSQSFRHYRRFTRQTPTDLVDPFPISNHSVTTQRRTLFTLEPAGDTQAP